MNTRRHTNKGLGTVVADLLLQRDRLADSLRQLDDLIAKVQANPGANTPLPAANDEPKGPRST